MDFQSRTVVLPSEPVVLTSAEIGELNSKLSKARHDINNKLTVLIAAIDLVRYKPDSAERWLASIHEQPSLIIEALQTFSAEFEKTLKIKKSS